MKLDNLQQAIERASAKTHIREFEVAGQMLTFPRLSIAAQGAFEGAVQTAQRAAKITPLFTLAATRNKAAMTMATVLERAKRAMGGLRAQEGKPQTMADMAEAKEWAQKLQTEVMDQFQPYADRIFSGITREWMLWAIAASMRAQYGENITYNTPKDDAGKSQEIAAPIDSALVDTLFIDESGGMLENVFLWVVGLAEQTRSGEATVGPGMSIEDIAKETIGDAENSEREQDSE